MTKPSDLEVSLYKTTIHFFFPKFLVAFKVPWPPLNTNSGVSTVSKTSKK